MSRTRLLNSLSARPGLWAFVVVAVGTALRLWFVSTSQLGLVQDEAQYWDWTRHIQLTYYSKGPLIAWIIRCGTFLFGDTELGVRIGAVVGMCQGSGQASGVIISTAEAVLGDAGAAEGEAGTAEGEA